MNTTLYKLALAIVALAVVANRGQGSKIHYGVQLYLMVLVLFVALAVLGK
jgi:hypothetical protein